METKTITPKELEMILESLEYSKRKFEEYDKYPSKEFKQERINQINLLISKIKSLID
jgi:hypothetical protein